MDEQRRPGRFVLSSSANLALLSQVSDTLPGRAVYFTLYPMARREIQGQTGQPLFLVEFIRSQAVPRGAVEPVSDRKVLTGGLPPACLGPAEAIGEQGSRMKLQGKAKLKKVQ